MTPELVTVRLVAARIGRGIEPIYMMLEAPDVATVARDLAVTGEGAMLIEGNSSRGLIALQRTTGYRCWRHSLRTLGRPRPDGVTAGEVLARLRPIPRSSPFSGPPLRLAQ